MNRKKLSLFLGVILLILSFSVVADRSGREVSTLAPVSTEKIFTPIQKIEPVSSSWLYVNKDGKVTTKHNFCTKRVSSNNNVASWGPTVVAYFANGKYGTTWKYCDVAKDGTVVTTGCGTAKWNYVDGSGIIINSNPLIGCTTMNNKGELGKEKPWCYVTGAYVYADKYGTKRTLCSKKGFHLPKR